MARGRHSIYIQRIEGLLQLTRDTLVYNFVIENDAVAEVVDIDTVRASLEAESDVYEGIAAMLPAIADVENPAVVVRYVNSSGDELLSMTFTAD